MSRFRMTGCLTAAVMLTGCANLFNADFESGTPGEPPGANPPGPPVGDSISVDDDDIYVITGQGAISGNRSLSIREPVPSLDPGGNKIVFRTMAINDPDAPIYVTWRGLFAGSGGIVVNAGVLGKFFGQVTFDNGQILMFDSVVGSYDIGDAHTVILSLFPASQTYRFGIFGDASLAEGFAEDDMRPIDSTPIDEGFVEVGVTTSSRQNLVYIMDDVTVSYNEPGG